MTPPDLGSGRGEVLARRYLLLEPLATGGMSVIWRAFDQSLQRMVAVKVLRDRARVRSEARAAARLTHPDLVEVYDCGETVTPGGRVVGYVVTRLFDGQPLAERVAEGALPWREAATIVVRLAGALGELHARGLVHRDVTADNVLLTGDGPKLLDFGIAAAEGSAPDDYGTPPYVAPERLAGVAVHPTVDCYALGVLLFEMVTGRVPYPETTWEQVESARRTGAPPRLAGVPRAVARVCADCLSPDPAARPSAERIAEELTTALAPRRLPWVGRSHGRWVVGAAVVGALAWWGVTKDHPAPSTPSPHASLPSAQATSRPSAVLGWTEGVLAVQPTLETAVDAFHQALDRGASCAGTPADVALDLRQVLDGAVRAGNVDHLWRKLDDRRREGRLAPRCQTDLRHRLTQISRAL
ncbi:serine/threonine-protein kinase [Nonomuraea sp. NPDC050556]|uniref:serine/threonine-protein kinase n=1 Tax=Nonomuraea sp. NPDC050556 TaxID=3364369 RepID=UPI00379A6B85